MGGAKGKVSRTDFEVQLSTDEKQPRSAKMFRGQISRKKKTGREKGGLQKKIK